MPLALKLISVIVPISVSLTSKLTDPSAIRNGERSKEILNFPVISSSFSVYKLKVRSSFSPIENIIEVTEQLLFELSEEKTHSPIIALVCSDCDPPDPPDTSSVDTCVCTLTNCCWI
ncbi:MAG: Uncharacterised protein [Flavobacteriaceae bacterium]|nr:MAG: Uncharacterised protein [Flavobacteriaceae bacterium]